MNTQIRRPSLDVPFASETTPRIGPSHVPTRTVQHHGLSARWSMVEGKLRCQWEAD